MTKNTPRIFISLLLMLLCIGILPVSAFASDGDYPDDALPTAEEPEKKSGVGGILVVLLIVALGGGAAFYIFKQKKAQPQTKGSADLDDYDYGEDEYEFEPYEDEPEQDTTEDTDA